MVVFLGCEHTLPNCVVLLVNQHLQASMLLRAVLHPCSAQPVLVLQIALTQVQHLSLGCVEFQEVHTGPPLKHVRVPLDDMPSLLSVATPQSFLLLTNFLRLCLIPVTNKDFKQLWSQYQFMRNAALHLSPL